MLTDKFTGIGRLANPDYMMFINVLIQALKSPSLQNKVRSQVFLKKNILLKLQIYLFACCLSRIYLHFWYETVAFIWNQSWYVQLYNKNCLLSYWNFSNNSNSSHKYIFLCYLRTADTYLNIKDSWQMVFWNAITTK